MKCYNELDHRVCKSIAPGTTGPSCKKEGGGGNLHKLNNEVSINSRASVIWSLSKEICQRAKIKFNEMVWKSFILIYHKKSLTQKVQTACAGPIICKQGAGKQTQIKMAGYRSLVGWTTFSEIWF